MRVWIIHPLVIWERLKEEGTLCVDPTYYHEGYIPDRYPWLVSQLQQRIPGYTGRIPWWAYSEKPDLRRMRHRRPGGQPQVRIELDVERVLFYPLWAWDIVYTGNFLAFTKGEQEAWDADLRQAVPDEDLWPYPEPWRSELEASWLRLFDADLPVDGWADITPKLKPYNEAVFEILDMRDVRSITHFVGSSPWSW